MWEVKKFISHIPLTLSNVNIKKHLPRSRRVLFVCKEVLIMDLLHKEQYLKNGFLPTALRIFKTGEYNEGQFQCLVGYEGNIIAAEEMIEQGYEIEFEKEIPGTRIDVHCTKGDDIKEIESKMKRRISNSVVKQLKKYKWAGAKPVLFIPKDAIIDNEEEIKKFCTIVRSKYTKADVALRVLRLIQ